MKRILDVRGFSLTETILTLGLTGITIMATTSVLMMQGKGIKNLKEQSSKTQLKDQIARYSVDPTLLGRSAEYKGENRAGNVLLGLCLNGVPKGADGKPIPYAEFSQFADFKAACSSETYPNCCPSMPDGQAQGFNMVDPSDPQGSALLAGAGKSCEAESSGDSTKVCREVQSGQKKIRLQYTEKAPHHFNENGGKCTPSAEGSGKSCPFSSMTRFQSKCGEGPYCSRADSITVQYQIIQGNLAQNGQASQIRELPWSTVAVALSSGRSIASSGGGDGGGGSGSCQWVPAKVRVINSYNRFAISQCPAGTVSTGNRDYVWESGDLTRHRGQWDYCCPKDDLQSPPDWTAAEFCKVSGYPEGYTLDEGSNQCIDKATFCAKSGLVVDPVSGECATQQAACESQGKIWYNNACLSDYEYQSALCRAQNKIYRNNQCEDRKTVEQCHYEYQSGIYKWHSPTYCTTGGTMKSFTCGAPIYNWKSCNLYCCQMVTEPLQ